MRPRWQVYNLTTEQLNNQNFNIEEMHRQKIVQKIIYTYMNYQHIMHYEEDLVQEVYLSILNNPFELFYQNKIDNFKPHIGYLKKIVHYVNFSLTKKKFKQRNYVELDRF